MVDELKRATLRGIIATAGTLVLPSIASADERGGSLSRFYSTVTSMAYHRTYGDKLLPENVRDEAHLTSIVSGTQEQYRDNFIAAAKEYVSTLSREDATALLNRLNSRPFRNGGGLLGQMQSDLATYTRGGTRPDIEGSNPLFNALYTLGEAGKITRDSATGWIIAASEIMHGKDTLRPFHERLVGELDTVARTLRPAAAAAPAKKF